MSARTSSAASVYVAMKAASQAPSSMTCRHMREAPAPRRCPGLIRRWASALAAVGEKTGSMTTSLAPRSTASKMKWTSGIRVSTGLEPTSSRNRLFAQSFASCSAFWTPNVIGIPIGRSPLKSKLVPWLMPRSAQAR